MLEDQLEQIPEAENSPLENTVRTTGRQSLGSLVKFASSSWDRLAEYVNSNWHSLTNFAKFSCGAVGAYLAVTNMPDNLIREFQEDPVYVSQAWLRHAIGAAIVSELLNAREGDSKLLRNPLFIIACGIAPDVIESALSLEHRGLGHSFAFSAAAGLAILSYATIFDRENKTPYFVLPTAMVASHTLVDLLVEGGQPLNPFWPLGTEIQIHGNTGLEFIGYAFAALGASYLAYRHRNTGDKSMIISGVHRTTNYLRAKLSNLYQRIPLLRSFD